MPQSEINWRQAQQLASALRHELKQPLLSPDQEARLRLQLADVFLQWTNNANSLADQHPAVRELELALARLHGLDEHVNLRFQCQLALMHVLCSEELADFKYALRLLKICTQEAKQRDLFPWQLRFMFMKLRLEMIVFAQCSAKTQENAETLGLNLCLDQAIELCQEQQWAQAQLYLRTVQAQLCIITRNWPSYDESRNHLLNFSVGSASVTLQIFVHIVLILGDFHQGNIFSSQSRLKQLHQLVEQHGDENLYHHIHLSLSNQHDDSLVVAWLSKSQVTSLVYLISGICVATESNLSPAKKFLLEGAKFVEARLLDLEQASDPVDGVETAEFYVQLKSCLYQQLIRILLTRCDIKDANSVLDGLLDWCSDSEQVQTLQCDQRKIWEAHADEIACAKAMLLQSEGKLAEAMNWYYGITEKTCRFEIRLWAKLHLAFIGLYKEEEMSSNDFATLMTDIRVLVSKYPSLITFQVCLELLEGLRSLKAQEFHQTKVHLLEALRFCSGGQDESTTWSFRNAHCKVLALSILGQVYHLTENEQADKMFSSAYVLAKKMRNSLLALFSGSMLNVLQQRNGDMEAAAAALPSELTSLEKTVRQQIGSSNCSNHSHI